MSRTANRKFGFTLRRLRDARSASQEDFAHLTGLERARYGKIERGELNISLRVLFSLSAHLNVTPAELLADITIKDCWTTKDGDTLQLPPTL